EIAPKLGKDANDNLYAVWVDRRMGRHIRFSSTIAPDLSTKFENIPSLFKLLEPFPNPFNPITTIRFNVDVEKELFASLNVIDIRGRIVEILLKDFIESGQHEIQWDASTYSSGIFFISLTANGQTKTVKSVLVK
ncbi:MAG: T9SS type A sorting domain-containing protein, partial [Candidatus Marinimicrobia bacterium]|nr:T9SS type A sorting domain-containing protein [Candidatus Neomarinimicrobiota bacterium]